MNTQLFHITTNNILEYISQVNWTDTEKRIDGHFWVEDEYGDVINDSATLPLKWMKERQLTPVYLPCENEDGKRYLREKLEESKKEVEMTGGEKVYYAHIKERGIDNFSCWYNALLISHRTGRPIKYGFFGSMDKKGNIKWFFGHPDNKYEDFEALEGKTNIKNERTTHIDEHPYLREAKQRKIKAEQDRKKAQKEFEEKVRKHDLAKKEMKAQKAQDELFALLDKEDKQNSKKKNNKRKR